jgi:hypothetical protein
MVKKTSPEGKDYKVGDKITAKLHDGRKVDATIRAVFQSSRINLLPPRLRPRRHRAPFDQSRSAWSAKHQSSRSRSFR